jgi:hypothetical protein
MLKKIYKNRRIDDTKIGYNRKMFRKKKLKRLTERATKASVLKANIKLEKGDIDTTTQRNGGNILRK